MREWAKVAFSGLATGTSFHLVTVAIAVSGDASGSVRVFAIALFCAVAVTCCRMTMSDIDAAIEAYQRHQRGKA